MTALAATVPATITAIDTDLIDANGWVALGDAAECVYVDEKFAVLQRCAACYAGCHKYPNVSCDHCCNGGYRIEKIVTVVEHHSVHDQLAVVDGRSVANFDGRMWLIAPGGGKGLDVESVPVGGVVVRVETVAGDLDGFKVGDCVKPGVGSSPLINVGPATR